jgi:hypothetical protein
MNWINSKEKEQNTLFIWAEAGRPKSEIGERCPMVQALGEPA